MGCKVSITPRAGGRTIVIAPKFTLSQDVAARLAQRFADLGFGPVVQCSG